MSSRAALAGGCGARKRYFLIGGLTLVVAGGLIRWHFWEGRGEVLKPDGGPVVTVMDFSQSFPFDPLPSGWRHRKFWTRSPMTMSFAVKDGETVLCEAANSPTDAWRQAAALLDRPYGPEIGRAHV